MFRDLISKLEALNGVDVEYFAFKSESCERKFRTKYAMNDQFSAINCCVVNCQILSNDGTHGS